MPPRGRGRGRAHIAVVSNRAPRPIQEEEDSSESDYLGHFEPAPVHIMPLSDPPIPHTSATILRRINVNGTPEYSVVVNPVVEDPKSNTNLNSSRAAFTTSSASRATGVRITNPTLIEGIRWIDIHNYVSEKELERFEHQEWEWAMEAEEAARKQEEEEEKAKEMQIRRLAILAQEQAALKRGNGRGRPGGRRGRGRAGRRGYGGDRRAAGDSRESVSAPQSGEQTPNEFPEEPLAENKDVVARRVIGSTFANGERYESSAESNTAATQQLREEFQVYQSRESRSKRAPSPSVVVLSPERRPAKKQRMLPEIEETPPPKGPTPASNNSSESSQPELFTGSVTTSTNAKSIATISGPSGTQKSSTPTSNGRTTISTLMNYGFGSKAETQRQSDASDGSDDTDAEILDVRKTIPGAKSRGKQPVRGPEEPRVERILDHLDSDGEVTYCAKFIGIVTTDEDVRWFAAKQMKDAHPALLAAYKQDYLEKTGVPLIDEEDTESEVDEYEQ